MSSRTWCSTKDFLTKPTTLGRSMGVQHIAVAFGSPLLGMCRWSSVKSRQTSVEMIHSLYGLNSAAAKMAEIVGDSKLRDEYTNSYESARQVYHRKLWNGKYYNYDSSNSPHHDSIMTDQMAGQWYAHACSLPPVVLDPDHARSALSTVYQYNVMQFVNGNLGAGM